MPTSFAPVAQQAAAPVRLPCRLVQRRELHHGDGCAWHNVALAWRVAPEVGATRLSAALDAVVAANETLRGCFGSGPHAIEQIVHPTAELPLTTLSPTLTKGPLAAVVGSAVAPLLQAPFPLDRVPLARAALIGAPAADVLVLVVPHMIWDAGSTAALEHALERALAGERPSPPALEAGDFALWEAGRAARPRHVERLTLPRVGRARDVDYLPATTPLALSGAALRGLAEVARAHRTSLPVALLTAVAVVIGLNAAADEVTLGMTHSNRDLPELSETLGFLIGLRAITLSTDPRARFAVALEQAHEAVARALADEAPIERAVASADPLRERSPFVDVVVNVVPYRAPRDMPARRLLAPLAVEPWNHWRAARASPWGCQFDLTAIERADGSAWGGIVRNETCLPASLAARLVTQLQEVVARAGRRPELPLARLTEPVDWRTA